MNKNQWVPDEEGTGCSLCHAEFSVTKRRHHCRKCGALVCGDCSDNFVMLSSSSSEVRVCDDCELKLREGVGAGEKMDVTAQITESLKQALKEKAIEEELFHAFFLHCCSDTVALNEEKLIRIQKFVGELCARFQRSSEVYSELKMDSSELERQIRSVAQRCLRAEDVTREGLSIARQIEDYSSRIGAQARLIEQLNERINRLTQQDRPTIRSSPASPRPVEVSEMTTSASDRASVGEAVKSLLGFP